MADSWVTVTSTPKDHCRASVLPKPHATSSKDRIKPQVKFMFGDDDSDSSRSCSVSLTSPLQNKEVGTSFKKPLPPRLSEKTNSAARNAPAVNSSTTQLLPISSSRGEGSSSGLGVAKAGLSVAPSSPSTRVVVTNAQGSPLLTNDALSNSVSIPPSQEASKDASFSSKLPLTTQSLLKNRVGSTQSHTVPSSPTHSNPTSLSPNQTRTAHFSDDVSALQARSTPGSPKIPSMKTPPPESTSSNQNAGNSSSGAPSASQGLLSRTQQKLLLQRQFVVPEDEKSLFHPQNHLRLTKEVERANREYGWVRRHHNPVLESLQRVMERKRLEVAHD